MDHGKYPISVLASEACVEHPGSIHAIKDKMEGMRVRDQNKEIDGDFKSVVPLDRYLPRKDVSLGFSQWKKEYEPRPFNASLRTIPSMMD